MYGVWTQSWHTTSGATTSTSTKVSSALMLSLKGVSSEEDTQTFLALDKHHAPKKERGGGAEKTLPPLVIFGSVNGLVPADQNNTARLYAGLFSYAKTAPRGCQEGGSARLTTRLEFYHTQKATREEWP